MQHKRWLDNRENPHEHSRFDTTSTRFSGTPTPLRASPLFRPPTLPSTIHFDSARHGLAPRTPVRRARIHALQPPADQLAAAPAGQTTASIDPQTLARVRLMRGAPTAAAIRHDPVARILHHVVSQLP